MRQQRVNEANQNLQPHPEEKSLSNLWDYSSQYFPNGSLNGSESAVFVRPTLPMALPSSWTPPATAAPKSAVPFSVASPIPISPRSSEWGYSY